MSSAVAQTELACIYSALILTDDGLEVTPDGVRNILQAAGYDCESFWPKFFCDGIKDLDINALLSNVSSAPVAAAAPVEAVQEKSANEGSKKKEPEPEEESDDDIGLGSMFG